MLAAHPAVREAVVDVNTAVNNQNRLVAYWVGAQPEQLSASDLRSYLQERLPQYMIPSVFVQLSGLPLTPSGKVDRKALPEPSAELGTSDLRVSMCPRVSGSLPVARGATWCQNVAQPTGRWWRHILLDRWPIGGRRRAQRPGRRLAALAAFWAKLASVVRLCPS